MTDYQKYINALRKCAKEHDNDITSFAHIIVSDVCRDTANLLEELEQESTGHWIKYECGLKCSECHSNPLDFVDTVDDNDNAYMSTPMSYCPNCGRKMI